MTTHKKAASESGSIANQSVMPIVALKSKRVAHTDDNEVVQLLGCMSSRKHRRVAAAHAKWLKRQEAKR